MVILIASRILKNIWAEVTVESEWKLLIRRVWN